MTDQLITLMSGAFGLSAVALMSVIALKGWRDWIGLRRFELERGHAAAPVEDVPQMSGRIELADLRERIRKLEAIAAGVDL